MVLSFDRLQALRDCCRDEAAFTQLRQLLGLVAVDPGNHPSETIDPPSPAQNNFLQNHSLLLQAIAEATRELLTGETCNIALHNALAILGRAMAVDRVYIFAIHDHPETGEAAASQKFEWVCEGVTPQSDNPVLQNRSYARLGLTRWLERLQVGQPISGQTWEFPMTEQTMLRSQGIRAILMVPIQIDGSLWGYIGFDDCHTDRIWSTDETSALQLMASSIGGAIARHQATQSSSLSEARNRALLNAIPDLMFRIRRDGTYLACKAEHDSYILMPPSEMIGKTVMQVLPPELARQRMEYIERALETRELQHIEFRLHVPHTPESLQQAPLSQGEAATRPTIERDFEARIAVCGEEEVLLIVRDITERKQAEAALRLSEEKFSKAFRSSPNPMTIATLEDGRLIEVNDSYVKVLGYSREESIDNTSLNLGMWVHHSDRASVVRLLQEQGSVESLEFQFRNRSGEIRTVLFSAEIIQIGSELCLIDSIVDITDRKRAEQQIQQARERDRLLAETALRIRQSLNLQDILDSTVAEVQQFLQADRVCIGHGIPGDRAVIVAEAVNLQWRSMKHLELLNPDHLREIESLFGGGEVKAIDDVEQLTGYPAIMAWYREFHVKAIVGVPILLDDHLFGLMVVHQCSEPRHWQQFEIDLLSRLATQVSIAVQQANLYEQVRQLNMGLEQQVQERTAQLRQKMEELQRLNDLKDEFLNAFSHDLKTPVMGLSLVISNLLNQPGDMIPISRSILERMAHSSDHQLQLIMSMLEAHSAETKGMTLHYELLQIGLLVQVIVEDLEPLVQKGRATLTNFIPPDLPLVKADPTQIRRVFENLITNALNHNPPGIHIVLDAVVEEDLIRFTVKDTGVGMSQETCDRLFKRYSRGPRSRHSTGIGLGLYLCRQIITAHGGQIGVESQSGAGATFWLTLPLAIPSGANPGTEES